MHSLTRDAVYLGLSRTRRARFHRLERVERRPELLDDLLAEVAGVDEELVIDHLDEAAESGLRTRRLSRDRRGR
jgi:hypothetical protein